MRRRRNRARLDAGHDIRRNSNIERFRMSSRPANRKT
jgi:hypothetical protein